MKQEKYIGMDVHQATISVAVMDSSGKLEVLVATNGTVKSVKVVGGHPLLVQAAEREQSRNGSGRAAAHDSTEPIELRFDPE